MYQNVQTNRIARFAAALRCGEAKKQFPDMSQDFEREARQICEQLAALDRQDDIVIDIEAQRV